MEKLKIVTFNIRTLYDSPHDGANAFIHRAGLILDTVHTRQPHVICFQECSPKIKTFLKQYLIGYQLVGYGRDADFGGEALCVAYRTDVMELFALEQFWLSPTPTVPGSRFENQSVYPRICTRVVVKHTEIAAPLQFFNVHLDHESEEARVQGIRLILDRLTAARESAAIPTFILGDFNSQPESEVIRMCCEQTAYPLIELTADIGPTFHDFGATGKTVNSRGWKIDYIFTSPENAKAVTSVTKWEDSKNGIYLSDHYPICCELEL